MFFNLLAHKQNQKMFYCIDRVIHILALFDLGPTKGKPLQKILLPSSQFGKITPLFLNVLMGSKM